MVNQEKTDMENLHELREILATLQHEIWSHWMRYLCSVSITKPDGSIVIPPEKAQRWSRQLQTGYSDLSEDEKKSDREIANKVLRGLHYYL